jgi:molybdopterin synthase sulfur carrier subunit
MKVQVALFGAFRDMEPIGHITVDLPQGANVSELRKSVGEYGKRNWTGFQPGLLARSAFASETAVLRDAELVPAGGRMAVLPPVSGG